MMDRAGRRSGPPPFLPGHVAGRVVGGAGVAPALPRKRALKFGRQLAVNRAAIHSMTEVNGLARRMENGDVA